MNDKKDILQIIGILMQKPTILSQVDKYSLTLADFSGRFEKYLFNAIDTLYSGGAKKIDIVDIENVLESNGAAKACFESNNGIEFLQDALEYSEPDNFDYYYTHLKKINLLKSMKKSGIDTSAFYIDDPMNPDASEVNQRFEELTIPDIIARVKTTVLTIEREFTFNDVTETRSAASFIDDVIASFYDMSDVGVPLQGEIFNEVISGARRGTLMIRSGSSGLGKSRRMVGDACYLAYPVRYDPTTEEWVISGNNEKVLYIMTEQDFSEIQRMILAYLTGINESKFKYGIFTDKEKTIINQAKQVMERFKDNLQLTRIPNPTNEIIKTVVRENCLLGDISYVFYDYIFIGPSLLNEFRGFNLRNDELLLILSTTLKDLAVELNVFMGTATQVNASADDNKNIRNEASLAGGRATINKADYGFIMARPTKEEIEGLKGLITNNYNEPNLVTDVFKVRAGEWTQVRIWSDFDRGTLRLKDLFVTNSRLEPIEIQPMFRFDYETIPFDELEELLKELNE